MRPFLLVLAMLCVAPPLLAQYVYTIKADSVRITNHCDSEALILRNHTSVFENEVVSGQQVELGRYPAA